MKTFRVLKLPLSQEEEKTFGMEAFADLQDNDQVRLLYFSVVSFRCVEIAKVLTLKFSGFDFETEHCGEYTLDDVSFYESHFDKQSFWFLFFSATNVRRFKSNCASVGLRIQHFF